MRRPLLLTVFALLAAATSPAQTFVFKGERWEINDPFKLDNSIPSSTPRKASSTWSKAPSTSPATKADSSP